MNTIHIKSYQDLIQQLNITPHAFVLLYKSGSEASECALTNSSEIDHKDITLLIVDVKTVKDIHTKYQIKTAPVLLSFKDKELENIYKGCNDVSFYHNIFENSYFTAQENEERPVKKRVTVYSTPSCSWCTTLKKHLEHNGIRYQNIDISRNADAAAAMQKKSGQQGVPQTDINGQMIVGFDKNKINSLLGIQ
ncbi:MAG: NrdH-redoxin [Bacteroidetes bacterium 4572_77]|nr:MAG: NrdH-redoxin [Bacteroidetes bacterium 4572_77]